jgi:hypothetical protein
MEGLWSKLECRSIHFTLIGLAGIQTELATYELHQKIKGYAHEELASKS